MAPEDDADDGQTWPGQRLQRYGQRLDRHELEQAAVKPRAAGMPCGSVMAVLMLVMRKGGRALLMPNVHVGRVVGRQCVVAVMFTAWTMGDPRPCRLQG